MQRIIRASTALLVSFAVVLPTVEAPQAQESRKPAASERDANSAADTAFIDRQQKMWGRLSASICTGCITATNRVAPGNYDRPGTALVAAVKTSPAKLETVQTAVRTAAAPRKFVALKKRYAKHHRRERLRLAARAPAAGGNASEEAGDARGSVAASASSRAGSRHFRTRLRRALREHGLSRSGWATRDAAR